VTSNITLPRIAAFRGRFGLVDREAERRTAATFRDRLHIRTTSLDTPVGNLSGGNQQKAMLAKWLSVTPRVLVLDEPTSSLGRKDALRLFEVIADLARQGHAVVYISHFIEEVKQVADRIVILRDGRVAGGGRAVDLPAPAIVSLMVGRAVEDMYPRTPRQRGELLLEATGFAGGSFALHRGEVLGIAGLVGAGRTRLLRSIFGLDAVKSGRVHVGAWTGVPDPRGQWQRGIGFLSEDRKGEGLALRLSVAHNLTASRLTGLGPGPFVVPSRMDQAASTWIDRVGIVCGGPRQSAGELSGGNQQKVALARLLHHDVDVLILDEPTRGIDVGSKAQIYRVLESLVTAASRSPKAVLLVSSYLPELLALCDRIAVMRRGILGQARPATDWDEHRLMMDATGAGDST
jgi:ribose transport system ATP-binding protein